MNFYDAPPIGIFLRPGQAEVLRSLSRCKNSDTQTF